MNGVTNHYDKVGFMLDKLFESFDIGLKHIGSYI